MYLVEFENLARRKTEPKSKRNDSARRRSDNQVKILGDRHTKRILQRGEKRGWDHALYPAAVDA